MQYAHHQRRVPRSDVVNAIADQTNRYADCEIAFKVGAAICGDLNSRPVLGHLQRVF